MSGYLQAKRVFFFSFLFLPNSENLDCYHIKFNVKNKKKKTLASKMFESYSRIAPSGVCPKSSHFTSLSMLKSTKSDL